MTASTDRPASNGKGAYAYPATGIGWRTVIVLLILYVLSLLDRSILQLMVKPVREALGLHDFEISLLVGIAFAATYAIAGLPLGYAADKLPRRRIVAFGVLLWGAATFACGLSRSFLQLFIARIGVGIGEAALVPASHSMIGDLFPPERRTVPLTVFQTGALIGGGVSFAIGGILVSKVAHVETLPVIGAVHPWQVVFFIIGIPSVLAALLVYTVPEPLRRAPPRRATGGDPYEVFRFIRAHGQFFIAHFGGFALLSMMQYGAIGWIPTFLNRTFGWSMLQAGVALASVILGSGILGTFGAAALVQSRFKRGMTDAHLRFQMWAAFVAAITGVGAFLAPTPHIFFVLIAICLTVGLMPITALGAASLQMIAPANLRGQLSALYLCTVNLVGGGIGPLVVASITDFVFHDDSRIGWSMAVTCAILAPIAGVLLMTGLAPLRKIVAEQKIGSLSADPARDRGG
jgi:MFS family permease